jgi:hypothetical protein
MTAAADRPVLSVTTAPSGFEGEGFPVRRAFAGVDLAALDPFVHQMGEVDYALGEPKGRPGIPTGGSRPSPTRSTACSGTRTTLEVVITAVPASLLTSRDKALTPAG